MKLKSAATISAGRTSGSMICQKMRNSPAPSTRAASESLLWQSEKELAQQEDEKGIAEKGGDDERRIRAQQTKVLEEHEGRDEDDDPRDQHGGDGDGKEQVTTREVQAREAVADRGT